MTTIAASTRGTRDEWHMAADSKVTDGDRFYSNQKIEVIDGNIIGLAGECEDCAVFFHWFRKGCKIPGPKLHPSPDTGFEGLLLNKSGLFSFAACVAPEKIDDRYYAIGTGAQAAMAMMRLRKSPVDGVKMARRIDPGTGGRIRVRFLKDL